MTLTNAWKRLVAPFKRAGSAFASFLGTYGVGTPGAWGGNRYEQVRHFTGWNYVGIKAICDEFAGSPPQVAIRRDESEIAAVKAKGGRFLSAKARAKALTSTQEGEDLQICDSDHRLVKLLHNPNGPDVSWSFNYKLMLSLELTGMAYVWMVPDALGLPAELWVIPPHWVFAVRESADTLVTEYEIRPRGTTYSGPTVRRPADEFIQIAYPHPFEPLEGYSPSQACAMWMDIAESVDQCRWSNFKNGIHGRTIITLDKDIADPDADTINRFRENFKARYGGESNAGEPIILSPGAGVADMRQSPTEMDYTGSTDQLRDMLMSARGVGKSIVGITEDVNFASSISATANFRFRTMRPKKTFIGQVLTEKLAKRFDERLAIYWPDDTPDDPAHELARMQAATAAGAVTPNEWREFVGLPPYPFGGDDPMLPMGLSPQPWQTGKAKPRPSVPMPGANGSTNGFAKPPGVGESSVPQATSDVSRIAAYFRNGRHKGGDFREEDHPRDDDGKFGSGGGGGTAVKPKPSQPQAKPGAKPGSSSHPGAEHGSTVTVKPSKQRAFDGKNPTPTKTTLTKQETGRVGEAIILAHLRAEGYKDAKAMNGGTTNFPVDMIEDHRPTEVKAGLCSNTRGAQQWRLTFSKESATEKALYEKLSPKQREKWNAEKQKRIHDRKQAVIGELQRRYPREKVKPRTMTVVINPDTRTADIYEFDGFHDRIDWQSDLAKNAYRKSVKYA